MTSMPILTTNAVCVKDGAVSGHRFSLQATGDRPRAVWAESSGSSPLLCFFLSIFTIGIQQRQNAKKKVWLHEIPNNVPVIFLYSRTEHR